MPRPLIVICTHHKTGTVWMGDICRGLKKEFGLKMHNGLQQALPPEADIFIQDHSRVDMIALRGKNPARPVRCVHIIRDPRDVVISGCFYHVKTTEKWANKPKPEYGGKTYREAISALPDDQAKLVFEMEHTAAKTIRDMLAWNYQDKDCLEIRYEDIINDSEFRVFRPMMQFLGFEGAELDRALEIVQANSLFGGAKKETSDVHVRSGESRQWRKTFTPELKAEFKRLHPDALQRLGYEKTADW
jgi:hypothetical protein